MIAIESQPLINQPEQSSFNQEVVSVDSDLITTTTSNSMLMDTLDISSDIEEVLMVGETCDFLEGELHQNNSEYELPLDITIEADKSNDLETIWGNDSLTIDGSFEEKTQTKPNRYNSNISLDNEVIIEGKVNPEFSNSEKPGNTVVLSSNSLQSGVSLKQSDLSNERSKSLVNLSLVNSATQEVVTTIEDLETFNLNESNVEQFNIIAEVNPDHPDANRVESIKFQSTLGNQVENLEPYALFGDVNGVYSAKDISEGRVEIKATAYSKDRGRGKVLASSEADFTIIDLSQQEVISDREASSQSLFNLSLVDPKTNKIISAIENLETFDLNESNVEQFNIIAEVNSDHPDANKVESIKFQSTLGNQVENLEPYALFGDVNGVYSAKDISEGRVEIKATAYSQDRGKGKALAFSEADFTIVDLSKPEVTSDREAHSGSLFNLFLVNPKTNKIISAIENLETFDLNESNVKQFNIIAEVNPDHPDASKVESIKFESTLGNQIESLEPYAIFGDSNGVYSAKDISEGPVEIKATAYSIDGGKGEALASSEANFRIIDTFEGGGVVGERLPKESVSSDSRKTASGDVLWRSDFSNNWENDWDIRKNGRWGSDNLELRSDPKYGNILRVHYPKGSASPAVRSAPRGGAEFKADLSDMGPQSSLRLSYDMRFSNNFDFVKGGKLPGLMGGEAHSGGNIPDGTDGFSARLMWRQRGEGEVYAYLPTSKKYGTSIGKDKLQFNPGQWHNVQQEIVLNSPGKSNGEIRMWVDDKLMHEENDVLFRTTDKVKIDGIFFSTFFGGGDSSWATPKNVYTDFANFSVSKVR